MYKLVHHLPFLLVITVKLAVLNSSMKFNNCSSKGPVSGLLWGSKSMSAMKTGYCLTGVPVRFKRVEAQQPKAETHYLLRDRQSHRALHSELLIKHR